jgi:hypothetical protein
MKDPGVIERRGGAPTRSNVHFRFAGDVVWRRAGERRAFHYFFIGFFGSGRDSKRRRWDNPCDETLSQLSRKKNRGASDFLTLIVVAKE